MHSFTLCCTGRRIAQRFSVWPLHFADAISGWGLPGGSSGRKHVQLLNYVIEITFITSIPKSKQILSTQNKSSGSQTLFHLCFPWVLGPTLVFPVIFSTRHNRYQPNSRGKLKKKAWTARKDITLYPSQIKNTFPLSSIQQYSPGTSSAPDYERLCGSYQEVSVLCPPGKRKASACGRGQQTFYKVTNNKYFWFCETRGKRKKISTSVLLTK